MTTLEQQNTDWMWGAACLGADPDMFFIDRGANGFTNQAIKQARAICRGCPVRETCLDYALDHHEVHGIWGATTPRERRALRRQRRGMNA